VGTEPSAATVEERLDRIEKAVHAMAWWLVQCQSGFGQRDAEGIDKFLRGERDAWSLCRENASVIGYVAYWWVAVLIGIGVPAVLFLLLVLAIWLGYRWKSDA
jgi:hypothetical protein